MQIIKTLPIISLLVTFCAFAFVAQASEENPESNIKPRLSTDEVENQIVMDKEANPLYESKLLAPIHEWKNGVAERTGFNWSIDYSAIFLGVSGGPGEDQASGGMVRFYGYWDIVNRGGQNKGSLNWKVESVPQAHSKEVLVMN